MQVSIIKDVLGAVRGQESAHSGLRVSPHHQRRAWRSAVRNQERAQGGLRARFHRQGRADFIIQGRGER